MSTLIQKKGENFMQPYSDDYMIFEQDLGTYRLTEKALLSRGLDLRARMAQTAAAEQFFTEFETDYATLITAAQNDWNAMKEALQNKGESAA